MITPPPAPVLVAAPPPGSTSAPRHRAGRDRTHVGALVQQAAAGDAAAWARLVADHEPLLRSIGRRMRLSREDTADAMQITWLALLTHVEAVRDPGSIAGWLATTMRNSSLRVIRQRRREVLGEMDLEQLGGDPDVDHALLAAEQVAAVREAVDRLAPRQRTLLRALLSTPAPSYEQVAEQMSISIGTVGPTRLRAVRRLRTLLRDQLEPSGLDLAAS